jgi:hypothetical protein
VRATLPVRAAAATILVGAGAALARRVWRGRTAAWYEPFPAYPSPASPCREGELVRLLLAGEITRDRYRHEIERLATLRPVT